MSVTEVTEPSDTNHVRPIRTSSDLYSFRRNDTYLHTFGVQNGNIIFDILYNRMTVCLLSIYGVGCLMLSWTSHFLTFKQFYFDVIYCIFGLFLWFWIVFAILSVNRIALRLMIKKFDFWVKIFFVIIFVISYNSWLFITNKRINTLNELNMIYLYIVESGLVSIDFILMITYYSLINGMQIKFKSKLYVGVILSAFCTLFAMQYLLFTENNSKDKELYTQIYPNYVSISWYSMSLSSIQILTLFLWKSIYLFKYKAKSIVINTTPSIQWIGGDTRKLKSNPINNCNNKNNYNYNNDELKQMESQIENHNCNKYNNNNSSLETLEGNDEYLDIESVELQQTGAALPDRFFDDSETLTPTPATASTSTSTTTALKNQLHSMRDQPNAFNTSTSL